MPLRSSMIQIGKWNTVCRAIRRPFFSAQRGIHRNAEPSIKKDENNEDVFGLEEVEISESSFPDLYTSKFVVKQVDNIQEQRPGEMTLSDISQQDGNQRKPDLTKQLALKGKKTFKKGHKNDPLSISRTLNKSYSFESANAIDPEAPLWQVRTSIVKSADEDTLDIPYETNFKSEGSRMLFSQLLTARGQRIDSFTGKQIWNMSLNLQRKLSLKTKKKVVLKNKRKIASYTWRLDGDKPTIEVPGFAPVLKTSRPSANTIKNIELIEGGNTSFDMNRSQLPERTFEPMLRAIMAQSRTPEKSFRYQCYLDITVLTSLFRFFKSYFDKDISNELTYCRPFFIEFIKLNGKIFLSDWSVKYLDDELEKRVTKVRQESDKLRYAATRDITEDKGMKRGYHFRIDSCTFFNDIEMAIRYKVDGESCYDIQPLGQEFLRSVDYDDLVVLLRPRPAYKSGGHYQIRSLREATARNGGEVTIAAEAYFSGPKALATAEFVNDTEVSEWKAINRDDRFYTNFEQEYDTILYSISSLLKRLRKYADGQYIIRAQEGRVSIWQNECCNRAFPLDLYSILSERHTTPKV
ncbi:hypothetical protein V1511DRAFT_369040 [Dipodascopsis uninucleata]